MPLGARRVCKFLQPLTFDRDAPRCRLDAARHGALTPSISNKYPKKNVTKDEMLCIFAINSGRGRQNQPRMPGERPRYRKRSLYKAGSWRQVAAQGGRGEAACGDLHKRVERRPKSTHTRSHAH
jgi:hypothetical protein